LPSFDPSLYCCCAASASSSPVFLVFFFLERFKDSAAMGGVSKASVEATLTTKLQPVHLDVVDTSGGCGASFDIQVVSAAFEGKRLLERHRLVNAALSEEMKEIHALSIQKALTPQQWKEQQATANVPQQQPSEPQKNITATG
jgi:stress-induced morphogen